MQQLQPQPQLAELLRTCVQPSSLLLRIVHVELLDIESRLDESNTSASIDSTSAPEVTRRYALKYVLSDGELMMQALLHRKLLRDTADIVVGDLLDIRRFAVKKSRRLQGHDHVVYLAVEDCHFLQQVRSIAQVSVEEKAGQNNTETRKRKRTLSHSENGPVREGSVPHMGVNKVANDILEPLPSAQPLVRKVSDDLLAKASNTDMAGTTRAATLPQSAHSMVETGEPESRSNSTAIAPPQESRITQDASATKAKSNQRDRSNFLKTTFGARQIMSYDDEDDDDFFEALPTNQNTVQRRRRALQKLDGNTSFGSQASPDTEQLESGGIEMLTPFKPPTPTKLPAPPPLPRILPPRLPDPRKSVRDGTFALSQTPSFYLPPPPLVAKKPQPPARQVQTQPAPQPQAQPALLPPPPFHNLASLRNPPPSQKVPSKSYTLTTLAVISWTGATTIHRPGSLFPPKRHLKIVDPSLSASRPPSRQTQLQQSAVDHNTSSFKGQNSFQDAVTVAVYIDAANFKPAAGMVVLFRGLVMQRLVNGDIILNAYGRLKDQRFEETTVDKKENPRDGDKAGESGNGNVPDQDQGEYNNHWFITDHSKIRRLGHGSRLDYYLDWWAEKQRGQQGAQT